MTRAGQFDEISRMFGRLEEQTRHLHECVHSVGERVDTRVGDLEKKVQQLQDELTIDKGELAKLKAKGAGLLIGVSIASGFAGSKLAAIASLISRASGH